MLVTHLPKVYRINLCILSVLIVVHTSPIPKLTNLPVTNNGTTNPLRRGDNVYKVKITGKLPANAATGSFASDFLAQLTANNAIINATLTVPAEHNIGSRNISLPQNWTKVLKKFDSKRPIKIYGEGSESRFPPFLEFLLERVQSYFSIYKYDDTSRPIYLALAPDENDFILPSEAGDYDPELSGPDDITFSTEGTSPTTPITTAEFSGLIQNSPPSSFITVGDNIDDDDDDGDEDDDSFESTESFIEIK